MSQSDIHTCHVQVPSLNFCSNQDNLQCPYQIVRVGETRAISIGVDVFQVMLCTRLVQPLCEDPSISCGKFVSFLPTVVWYSYYALRKWKLRISVLYHTDVNKQNLQTVITALFYFLCGLQLYGIATSTWYVHRNDMSCHEGHVVKNNSNSL